MKSTTIAIGLLISIPLLIGLASCQPEENPQLSVFCQLLSANDQIVGQSGQLTDELKRAFTYSNNVLTALSETSTNSTATFQITYANDRAVQAINGQDTLRLTYAATATTPVSATFSQGGQVHSTFAMTYDATGRMTRVTESRLILVPNSLITERSYTFTYDNVGNVTNQLAQFNLVGNVQSGQEVVYTFGQHLSPYTYVSELPLLTLVALSQAVETKPARFWQHQGPISYQLYNLNTDGSRANVIDASTYASVSVSSNKITSQDQTALLYTGNIPTPITKTNRQTFVYQCQ